MANTVLKKRALCSEMTTSQLLSSPIEEKLFLEKGAICVRNDASFERAILFENEQSVIGNFPSKRNPNSIKVFIKPSIRSCQERNLILENRAFDWRKTTHCNCAIFRGKKMKLPNMNQKPTNTQKSIKKKMECVVLKRKTDFVKSCTNLPGFPGSDTCFYYAIGTIIQKLSSMKLIALYFSLTIVLNIKNISSVIYFLVSVILLEA